jgi:hypothetical protein
MVVGKERTAFLPVAIYSDLVKIVHQLAFLNDFYYQTYLQS